MTTPFTKYQLRLILELVCPFCKQALTEASKRSAKCAPCSALFVLP